MYLDSFTSVFDNFNYWFFYSPAHNIIDTFINPLNSLFFDNSNNNIVYGMFFYWLLIGIVVFRSVLKIFNYFRKGVI